MHADLPRFATRLPNPLASDTLRNDSGRTDKIAIGFPVIIDPVAGPIPDVKHPYYGPTEINYDTWVGYSRKLWNKYNWSVQLNLKNLGVGNELVPVNAQPDGTRNSWRIAEATKWTLTSTISF